MAIACKKQTLTTNRLAVRTCCLHTLAVRSWRTSTFADASGDKLVIRPCGYSYRTVARYYTRTVGIVAEAGGEVCRIRLHLVILLLFHFAIFTNLDDWPKFKSIRLNDTCIAAICDFVVNRLLQSSISVGPPKH